MLEARVHHSPDRADGWRDLGWRDLLDGDRAAASDELSKALAIAPDEPRALFGLGALAAEGGRLDVARDLDAKLLEATARNPKQAWAIALAEPAAAAIERWVGLVPGEVPFAQRLRSIDARRLPPEAASRLLGARAALARRPNPAPDEAEGARLDGERGCPARVVVEGPFGHLPHLDLDRPFAPEEIAVVKDRVDPARHRIDLLSTTSLTDGAEPREVPTRACRFGVETRHGQPGVAYAAVTARAERDTVATITVESDVPWHLLVDGETRYRQDPRDRFPPRVTALDVPLAAGAHRVALKLSAPGPRAEASLRFASPAPLRFSTERAPLAKAKREPGAIAIHRAPQPPSRDLGDPRLGDYLELLRAVRDGDPDAGEAAAARLASAAPKFVPGLLAAARVAGDDPSRPTRFARDRARRLLERALAADAHAVDARLELAEMDVQDEHPDRALALLAEAPSRTQASVAQPVAGHDEPSAWRLAIARYDALRSRGWLVEAERAAAEARAADPEACAPIQAELTLAQDRRDPAAARRTAEALARCAPLSDELATVLRQWGEPAAAAKEYRRLLALDPSREGWWADLAEALEAAGDTKGAIEVERALVASHPRVAAHRRRLADSLVASGDAAGARRVLLDGLAHSPEAQELHRALLGLGLGGPMEPFRLDGKQVIRAFEQSRHSYDSPAVIVLDRTVTRVFPTGARLTLTHNIMRVQTKEGIDKFGEVSVPEGADVLVLRTVKADGSTREPEEIAGKQSVSVPDLEPGDYVEFEYVDPSPAPGAFPGGFLGERFYFQSFDAPLDRTEYVLATPPAMPLAIDTRGAAPAVSVEKRRDPAADADVVVRTWADARKAQLLPEPQQAPFTEYVPSVRAGARLDWAAWRDWLVDESWGAARGNEELRALAKRLATPDAIDEWVRRNVKHGGPLDLPATAALAAGEGNRVTLERALLAAAGIPSTVWLARPSTAAVLDGGLPDLEAYDEPLLAVGGAGTAVRVIDPRFRHAPAGFVSPLLRGMRALSLADPASAKARFEPVPGDAAEPAKGGVDDRRVTLEAKLAADGSADVTVRERLVGWPALEWREGLDRIPEDRVRAEFEQHTLGFYFPGATLDDLRFGPRDDDAQPFEVTYRFHAPRLARVEGAQLVVPSPFPALLGKRFVGVATRETPLQLPYAAPTTIDAVLHLPAGAVAQGAAPVDEKNRWGVFTQESQAAPGTLRLRGTFALAPARVPAEQYAQFARWTETVDGAEARAATVTLR